VETLSGELRNLHALLEKHMLRRLKRDVLRGLPAKRAVEVPVPLTPFQREVYADVLARNHFALNSTVNATQRTTLNNTLKELQKVCNHPFLYPAAEQDAFKAARKSGLAGKLARDATRERRAYREKVARENEAARLAGSVPQSGGDGHRASRPRIDSPDAVWIDGTRVTPPMLPLEPLPATLLRTSSGKMQLLAKLLPKLRARGHRVLLFCQMTRMLDVVDDWLRASGVGMERDPSDPSGMRGRRVYSRVDGATPSTTRQRVIEAFNAEESEHFLMLVSTRAGGLGLNLATADTVIMYDPDFNPFVDEQAQSRAHRMGQRKEVCVYQLVTANTVEERIVELAKSKRAIERLVVVKGRATDDATDASALKERDDDTTNDRDKETGGERQKTKDGSVSRAAELAKVLMHGARKIVTRAAASAEGAENDPTSLEKKVNPKCAFRDSEIERLLDRANLPVEADGEDGDGYLGGVGDGRVRLENDEDEEEKDDDAPTPERPNPGEDLADAQLESLLAERAARLVSAERELLGRGKRERRTILPTNVERMRGEGENGGNELSGNEFSGRFPEKPDSDPDPFVTPCFICLDAENDVAAFPAANTLLRCESCTACAHPACAGVDEDDDETLFSAVLSAGGVSAPPRAWHCGSGGFACACHGKRIDGGRAAATASAALARRDVAEKHARRLAKRLAKQQNDAQNAQNARSTHGGSSSDDDSDSMSTGANADDSDDGYDPGARSDSESESEFREGAAKRRRSASGDFVSGDGRKKRRVSLGDASTHLHSTHSTKALESETRNARLAKTLGAFTSQLDWLKRNAGGAKENEKLFVPTGGENAGSADPKKKNREREWIPSPRASRRLPSSSASRPSPPRSSPRRRCGTRGGASPSTCFWCCARRCGWTARAPSPRRPSGRRGSRAGWTRRSCCVTRGICARRGAKTRIA